MEISNDLLLTLNSCSSEMVSNDTLKHMIQVVSRDVLNSFYLQNDIFPHKSINKLGTEEYILKDVYTGLAILIAEGIKNDISAEGMRAYLEECNWDENKINLLLETYCKCKHPHIAIAQKIGLNLSNIVDVDWRLDYYIKNKDIDKVNQPCYIIKLKVELQGKTNLEEITFLCSFEELQDLVSKLKDICKTIEKIEQS